MKYLFLALGILSLTFTFAVSKDMRSGKQINTACMQSAIAARDNALVLGLKEYNQELEAMVETRKFTAIALWSGNVDIYKARETMNILTTSYQKTLQTEARAWNAKKQEIWREYIENTKTCGKKDSTTSRIDIYL